MYGFVFEQMIINKIWISYYKFYIYVDTIVLNMFLIYRSNIKARSML